MGVLARNFNPDVCRSTCHRIGRTNRVHCKGIRGPLTKDQIAQYCPHV